MFFNQSLIKRYTPPTCTLKIFSPTFSWTRWKGIITPQELSFELDLDDPRLPQHQQLTLKGNYQQLQILSQTVKEYVEQLLLSSQLQSNLLQHRLTPDIPLTQPIELSPTQLFDLANALEQSQQEMTNQFSLNPIQPRKKHLVTTISAASVLLLISICSIAFKSSKQTETTTTSTQITTTSQPPQTDIVILNTPRVNFSQPKPVLPPTSQEHDQLLPPQSVMFPKPESKIPLTNTNTFQASPTSNPPARNLSKLPILYSPPQINPTPSISPKILSPREEVQDYFQQRWQVPEKLREKLEYRLIISQSGTLESITPIGRAALVYLDTIKPNPQDPLIISSQKAKTKQKIRLILTPTGLVETFNEDS